jgi:predicted CoA-binding protein
MGATTRADIDSFLAVRRIALIGLSRDEKHFSRVVFEEFKQRGYDVVPVNPGATEVAGLHCYASVEDVSPGVEAALVMTPAMQSESAVEACAAAGVKQVWLSRSGGQGAVSEEAVAACGRHGLRLVNGECPMMFLPDTAWYHRLHRGILRLVGSLPQ